MSVFFFPDLCPMKFISRNFFYELTNTVHRIWKRIAKQFKCGDCI